MPGLKLPSPWVAPGEDVLFSAPGRGAPPAGAPVPQCRALGPGWREPRAAGRGCGAATKWPWGRVDIA